MKAQRMKMTKRKHGQSLVEFFFSLLAFFSVAFMIVQIGISFGVANYIQYATFMSSRAYLSGWKNAAQQRRAAETVIDRMMTSGGQPRFKAFAKPTEDAVFIGGLRVAAAGSSEARTRNWEQGMTYKFDARMHMIPLIRSSSSAQDASIHLQSQSWLGREPSSEECDAYMNQIKGPEGSSRKQIAGAFIYDNGC